MATKIFVHQLVIVLIFSHLIISLNSRSESESLLPSIQHVSSFNKALQVENWRQKLLLELNDYPGTGPNPGHTPGPPPPTKI
ncbi:hypothetical protein M5689_003459 [Euphorbia peplus]|nr:hypothetical protein M5689_003459 [Euphorbia peplus]